MKPLITVITVCRNCENLIEKTMQSVLSQTYDAVEYIIIDGKSTDGTLAVVEKYATQISRVISEPDAGIYDAMNKGLKMANGEWVIFMHAGDCFFDEHVLENLHLEDIHQERCGAVYGDYQGKLDGQLVDYISNKVFYEKTRMELIKNPSMGFHHQSVLVRTALAQKWMFDTHYKLCADYNMILHIYQDGYELVYRPSFVAIVEMSEGYTASHWTDQLQEHYQVLGLSHHPLARWNVLKGRLKDLKNKILGRKI